MGDERGPTADGGELQHDARVGDLDLTHWYTPLGRTVARVFTEVGRRVGAHPALALTLTIGLGVAFLMSFLVSRVYDAITDRDGVAALDRSLLLAARSLRNPFTDGLSAGVAELFGPVGMPIMAVVAILILSLRRRSVTPLILIVAAGAGSLLMTIAGKDIIDRHRPPRVDAIPPFESSASFPSGHTLNATVIAGMIGYLVWLRRHAIAARIASIAVPVVIAIVVGLTRILLGAHWFTDVLAGWLLGAAWLALVVTAHRLYLTARRRGAPPGPEGSEVLRERDRRRAGAR